MKIKKSLHYKSQNQIWRLLISENDYLLIETRDTNNKEVFFNCFDLNKSQKLFLNMQFEEKYWLGIEKFHKNILLLHRFTKPDMPDHKGIIAFDVVQKKIIWQNDDLTFLFLDDESVFGFVRKFEGRIHYKFDLLSGQNIEQLDFSNDKINSFRQTALKKEDFSNYIFPSFWDDKNADTLLNEFIQSSIISKDIVGNIEFAVKNDFLCFNFYFKSDDRFLINKFICYNIPRRKLLIDKIINTEVSYPAPDSFFIYKNLIIFLKDKLEIYIYKFE